MNVKGNDHISKKILLIEDNEKDSELILVALENCKQAHNVYVVDSGIKALDYLFYRGEFSQRSHEHPWLILLDLKMPRVDGFEVLKKIKDDSELKNIPVVVFTSSSQDEDVSKCYTLGANAYVIKPIDFNEFQKIIEMICYFWLDINRMPPDSFE